MKYKISKDWKRLLEIAREGKIKMLLFYWPHEVEVKDRFMLRMVSELRADVLTDEQFIDKASRYNYAFIDPEADPISPQTIYYSDGTVVRNRVNEVIIDIPNKLLKKKLDTIIFINGIYYMKRPCGNVPIETIYFIKWDNNRMVNVSKVEE